MIGLATTCSRLLSILFLAFINHAHSFSATIWEWKGQKVYTEKSPSTKSFQPFFQENKPSVLLIHGFGCSTTYWRETAAALVSQGYTVHALDLLGQGQSSKPGRKDGFEYSIDLWAELVDAYARENIDGDIVLAGNSLGSLVALSAATGDFQNDAIGTEEQFLKKKVKGICMFNCGVGLNSRGVAKELPPLQRYLFNAFYDVLCILIFNNQALLGYVLDEVVTKDLLRDTLQSLYKCNPDRVDDELVDSFYLPAKDAGSVEALSQIYANDPGSTPMELHARHSEFVSDLPIHLVWGDDDAVTPLEGGVGQFYSKLSRESKSKVSFDLVKSGHVPFDDNPVQSNGAMIRWLEDVIIPERRATEDNVLSRLFGR